MARYRRFVGAIAALAAVAVALVTVAPSVQAQAECIVSNEATMISCIAAVNDGSHTVMRMTTSLVIDSPLPVIDTTNQIKLEGNGNSVFYDLEAGQGEGTAVFELINSSVVDFRNMQIEGGWDGVIARNVTIAAFENVMITGTASDGVHALNQGQAKLKNTTVHNSGDDALQISNAARATVDLSTIVDNAYGLFNDGSSENILITDSILARNVGENCVANNVVNLGGNLSDDATCGQPATTGLGDTLSEAVRDTGVHRNSTFCSDCMFVVRPLPGSLAIDHAATCSFHEDMRQAPRVAGRCDAGAFEATDCTTALQVVSHADELSYGIGCYNTSSQATQIELDADINLLTRLPRIEGDQGATLTIDGKGHTIDGSGVDASIVSMTTGSIALSNVTLANAERDGIYVDGGFVDISGVILRNNAFSGLWVNGGVEDVDGSIKNSTIIGNARAIRVSNSSTIDIFGVTMVDQPLGVVVDGNDASAFLYGSLLAGIGAEDCQGQVLDRGGNVAGDASCTGQSNPGVRSTLDTALAANGKLAGFSDTFKLLTGSPAIGANRDCVGLTIDARGIDRPTQDCDAGAFQLAAAGCSLGAAISSNTALTQPECDALVGLYRSTSGAQWTDSSGWSAIDAGGRANPCDWFGITCVQNRPSELSLVSNGLSGPLPLALSGLTELVSLDLSFNRLSGSIPVSLGGLANLQELRISGTGLSGSIPSELGGLSNLQTLSLSLNSLSGSIPSELGGLSNLQTLDLSLNSLVGSIPSQLGGLSNLETLRLGENSLSGSIPPALGGLTKLRFLDLDENDLSGLIPSELGGLDNLDSLFLTFNSLSGGVTSALVQKPDITVVVDDINRCVVDSAVAVGGFPPCAVCNGLVVTHDMNLAGVTTIAGTTGNDVFLGTSGDDTINALGGDDTVCAGDGRDRVFGGDGVDTIFGGFGIDYIHGEAGNDVLDGDGGSDRMWGGPGDDEMLGDSGADRMFGGPGNDTMRGMGGQDFMWGELGNDVMQGNFQTDNMWGGPGNDELYGAGGKDSLFGEAGNDDLFGGNNTDYLDGGDGEDTANGGRGRDKPLMAPSTRASNGQLFGGSGCIAETILNCQPTP